MNNLNAYPEIYMPCPFAGEADNSGTEGTNRSKPFSDSKSNANVNMRTGFPSVFTLAQSANGKYLSRPDMNQLGYLATVGHFRRQIGCLNEFNSTFAGTIGGYAKGAVLDYVVRDGASADSPIKEVWKIMSLGDKEGNGVKLAPSSSSIADFNTKLSDINRDKVQWLRIVPDKAYLEALETRCNEDASTKVATERTRAEGVEAQKINTATADARYASGGKFGGGSSIGVLDGTARDVDGQPVESQHTAATASQAGITVQTAGGKQFIGPGWVDRKTGSGSSVLSRNTNLAVSGHVHTNMYTKAEVDAKIQSMGGEYAAGTSQSSGLHNGTYRTDGFGNIFGHKHVNYAQNSCPQSALGSDTDKYLKDGTAWNAVEGGSMTNNLNEVMRGHIHANYATIEYVDQHSGGGGTTIIDEYGAVKNYKIAYAEVVIEERTSEKSGKYGSVTFSNRVVHAVATLYSRAAFSGSCACYISWNGNTVSIMADNFEKVWPERAMVIALVE